MTVEKERQGPPGIDAATVWRRVVRSRVLFNQKAHAEIGSEGLVRISVPLRRPSFLVPPISWFIKPRDRKTLQLDSLGSEIYSFVRTEGCVGGIVDRFAMKHGLTFHESRVSVTQFINLLVENGVCVVALSD